VELFTAGLDLPAGLVEPGGVRGDVSFVGHRVTTSRIVEPTLGAS